MQHLRLIICFIVGWTIHQLESAPSCDLKTIFRTPVRRNYDQFEILERSNFDLDESEQNTHNSKVQPKSFANAQVLLRFGGNDVKERKELICPNQCPCGYPHPPTHPHPYLFYPVPPPPMFPSQPQCFCISPHYPFLPPFSSLPCPYNPSIGAESNKPVHYPFLPPYPCPCLPSIPLSSEAKAINNDEVIKPVINPSTTIIDQSETKVNVEDNSDNNQVNIVNNQNVINEAPQVTNTNIVQKVENNVVKENVAITNNHPKILSTLQLTEENANRDVPAQISEVIEENVAINNNHPEILSTIQLTEENVDGDVVQILEVNEEKTATPDFIAPENVVDPQPEAPRVQMITVDLNDAPNSGKHESNTQELKDSLIPYTGRRRFNEQSKWMVSYPIFNRPDDIGREHENKIVLPKEASQIVLPQVPVNDNYMEVLIPREQQLSSHLQHPALNNEYVEVVIPRKSSSSGHQSPDNTEYLEVLVPRKPQPVPCQNLNSQQLANNNYVEVLIPRKPQPLPYQQHRQSSVNNNYVEVLIPRRFQHQHQLPLGGYRCSSGSSYYSDPLQTVIYRRPTQLSLFGSQGKVVEYGAEPSRTVLTNGNRDVENVQYVLAPSTENEHGTECPCSGCSTCAKYVGELNEL